MSAESPTALITGSTRGIGLATARTLIASGWRVGVNGRDARTVSEIAAQLGDAAIAVPFDAADEKAVLDGMSSLRRSAGGVQAVIHCAGTMRDAPLGMLTRELIDAELSSNVVSSLLVTQTAARIFGRNGGVVVLVGSVVGEDGAAGQSLYGAAKAAIGGIVRSAAKELGPRGIRVNGVVPGIIDTDLIAGVSPERRAALAEVTALRRSGEASDVADVIRFLVSDAARFVTGEMIRVTGGLALP